MARWLGRSCALALSMACTPLLNGEAAALERYQAYVGNTTWHLMGPLAYYSSSDCAEVMGDQTVPYVAGQDVEFHFTSRSLFDITQGVDQTVQSVCYAPLPVSATLFGYGSPVEDDLSEGFFDYYTAQDLKNLLARSPVLEDGYVYVSMNMEGESGGFDKVRISEFVTRYEAGDFSHIITGSDWVSDAGVMRTVYSPLFGAAVLRGGDGNDHLISRGGKDVLYGENGNDIMDAGQEAFDFPKHVGDPDADPNWTAATFYGGLGDDIYYVKDNNDKFIENPGEGFDIAVCVINKDWILSEDTLGYGGYSFTYETDIEVIAGNCAALPPNFTGRHFPNLFFRPEEVLALNGKGTSLSDAIKFYEDSLALDAGSGDDLVVTGGGDDDVAGGTGNDIISSGGGNDQVSGGDGDDIIVDTEGSTEASGSAPVVAPALADVPVSMAGLPAGSFGDYFNGGTGTDTLRYSVPRAAATVTPQPDGSVAIVIGDSRDVLVDVERLQFTDQTIQVGNDSANKITGTNAADKLFGFAGNDNIIGNGGNDEIDGGTGADIMSGGDGDDSYIVDNAGDKVKENARAGSGYDKVYTALPSYTMPANVEELVYTGEGRFAGSGNKSANRMTGGPAADVLDGRQGADVMIGLGGDDSYVVDSVADLVEEQDGGGTDAIVSSVGITTLSDNVEVLSLKKGNINGRGNDEDNYILGSSGQNILEGGNGADTLVGGLGNDTFYGETSASPGDDADTVSYAGAKKGVVFSLLNTAAGQNTGGAGTDRIYEISGIENLTGGNFNDMLTGSFGANVIHGAGGSDVIFGYPGPDVIHGDAGADLIDPGTDTDADRVAYAAPADSLPGAGRDQVASFTPGYDVIDLEAMDANTIEAGEQDFVWGGTTPAAHAVWYAVSGTDVILSGDVTGDAIADFEVLLKGVASLEEANLAL